MVECHEHKTHKPPFTVLEQSSGRKLQPVLAHWPLFHSGGRRGKLFFPYVRGLNDTNTQYCNTSSSSLLLTYQQAVPQHIQTIKQIPNFKIFYHLCTGFIFSHKIYYLYSAYQKHTHTTATSSHTECDTHLPPPPKFTTMICTTYAFTHVYTGVEHACSIYVAVPGKTVVKLYKL